jgi:hypothetical protein
MFCPKCSEAKTNETTQYCTKCGFDLRGLQDFVEKGGFGKPSHRNGVAQGVKLILLSVLIIPVWLFIGPLFPANDVLIESSPSTTWFEQVTWTLMWVTFLAGVARIVFAYAFERGTTLNQGDARREFMPKRENASLPDGGAFRTADPGRWRTTDELFEPAIRQPRTSGDLR